MQKENETIQYFEERAQKEKKKKEQKARDKNAVSFSNAMLTLTKKMAKDKGKENEINLYGGEFAPYFANYVKLLDPKSKLTDGQAVEKLNDDFIVNIQGNFLSTVKKEKNILKAFDTYQNVCGSVEVQLKKEFGESNYHEMEYSANNEAREKYLQFEAWKVKKEEVFKELGNIDASMLAQIHTPNEMVAQSSAAIIAGVTIVGAIIGGANALHECDGLLYHVAAGAFMGFCGGVVLDLILSAQGRNYDDYLTRMAAAWNFDSKQDMITYLHNEITALPKDEQTMMFDYMKMEVYNQIAVENGYDNYSDAIRDIEAHKQVTSINLDEMMSIISNARKESYEDIADKNGQGSYSNIITYLENHITSDVDVSKGVSDWSKYTYDNSSAKLIAEQLAQVDDQYDRITQIYCSMNWPHEAVIYAEGLEDMVNQYASSDVLFDALYENVQDNSNVFSTDELALSMYNHILEGGIYNSDNLNKALDLEYSTRYSGGLSSEDTLSVDTVQTGAGANAISDVLSNTADNTSSLSDAAMMGLAGAGIGVAAGFLMRTGRALVSIAREKKARENCKPLMEINEQVEQDKKEADKHAKQELNNTGMLL